jgi:chromosome segregation ATPase
LGGGACYAFASHYEKRREELAGKENDLDARLKYVKGLNEDSEKLNKQLNTRLAEVSRRTDEISAEVEQGTITRQQLAKERAALQKEEQAARDQVELQKTALEDMKRFQAQQSKAGQDDPRIAELDAEIAKQERLLKEAQGATTAFAAKAGRI